MKLFCGLVSSPLFVKLQKICAAELKTITVGTLAFDGSGAHFDCGWDFDTAVSAKRMEDKK